MILKFDQENSPVRPDVCPGIVRTGLTLESRAVTYAFYNASYVSGDTELVHLFRDGDVVVCQRSVVYYHVLGWVGG